MLFKAPIPSLPFIKWLLSSKENRILLIVSMVVSIIVFIWYKVLYPFPNIFPDSYEYIAGAIENRLIDYRPIGYSKFLQLVHLLTSSHVFLVAVQYLLLQVSLIYFLLTIKYTLQPGKWVFRLLLLSCLFNPIIPHVSNFVSSDPLFTALSLTWLTQIIWIIIRPNLRLLILHGLIVLLVFVVRYNALYYPFISVLVILFSQAPVKAKNISIGLMAILLGSYIGFNQYQFKKVTGIVQFAPFSGWQTLCNALVAYYHAPNDPPSSVPVKFRALHAMVNVYKDSLKRTPHSEVIESVPYYMWGDKSPALKYLGNDLEINHNSHPQFKRWATIAPFYAEYGNYLIMQHPDLYIKHYLVRNLNSYNKPSPEYIGIYNSGLKTIGPEAVKWFQLKTNKITNNNKTIPLTRVIAYSNGALNLLLALGLIGFLGVGGFKKSNAQSKQIITWLILIWVCNMGFSVLASPIFLRYLTVQIILTFLIEVLFLEFIVREYKMISIQENSITNKKTVVV